MNDKEKVKNLKDLDYNHILNKQNIALVLVETALLYVIFTENLPSFMNRRDFILFLILMGIVFMWYFGRELNKIKTEIKSL